MAADRNVLAAECRVLYDYLVDGPAPADVINAYQRAHEVGGAAGGESSALDRALLRLARTGPAGAQLADSYAALLARSSLLRRKVVLLLAILESRAATADALDTAIPGSRAAWIVELAWRGGLAACRVALAAALIAPLRVWYRFAAAGQR